MNFDLSDGEFFLLIVCGAVGMPWLIRSLVRVVGITSLACPQRPRVALAAIIAVCHVALWLVLSLFAASNVRSNFGVSLLFLLALTAALAIATVGLSLLGVDALADGVERNNPAARLAASGLWLAVTACSIGANIGEGDFVGTTLYPLTLGLAALLGVAVTMALATRGLAPIALERDRAAGLRLGALLLACGLPLARAGAGDWVSFETMTRNFLAQGPALAVLLTLAVGLERIFKSDPSNTTAAFFRRGVAPAIGFLGLGVVAFFLAK